MSRHLERLLEIDRLLRSSTPHTQVSIAKALEVSERTIRNDFDFLRNRFDAPLQYAKKCGWYYSDPNWRLPSIPVTQGELFALTLGARMLTSYSGSIYQDLLQDAINRIAARLPDKSILNLRLLAEEHVHFRVGGEIQLDPHIWQVLIDACERSQSVLMRYYSPKRRAVSQRRFDPYQLDIYRASNPYIWGYCHQRRAVRQFRIDRIQSLDLLDERFDRKPFDLKQHLEAGFQYELGGIPHDVAIAFDARTAPYITERKWHSTQTIETYKDGSITLRFRASGLNDIKRWILGYGTGAIAKSPPELVDMLRQETERMARQNETGEFE